MVGGLSTEKGKKVTVCFPFIFPHPRPKPPHPEDELFRSNIRLNQTYDQIGIFSGDERVGQRLETTPQGHTEHEQWGHAGGPDYGVFSFTDLFADALHGKRFNALTKAQRTAFAKRFEHKVSDHMPIWLRMPLPRSEGTFPTKA